MMIFVSFYYCYYCRYCNFNAFSHNFTHNTSFGCVRKTVSHTIHIKLYKRYLSGIYILVKFKNKCYQYFLNIPQRSQHTILIQLIKCIIRYLKCRKQKQQQGGTLLNGYQHICEFCFFLLYSE